MKLLFQVLCWPSKCHEKCGLSVGGPLRDPDFKGITSCHLVVKAVSAAEARRAD